MTQPAHHQHLIGSALHVADRAPAAPGDWLLCALALGLALLLGMARARAPRWPGLTPDEVPGIEHKHWHDWLTWHDTHNRQLALPLERIKHQEQPVKKTPSLKHCRSCGAPIYWATHAATGRSMPVDAEPVPNGNVLLTYSPHADSLTAEVLAVGEAPADATRPRRTSHFATCAHAVDWRGRGGR